MKGGQDVVLADTTNQTVRPEAVPRAGFEPARPFGQRILRAHESAHSSTTYAHSSANARGYVPRFYWPFRGAGGQR